MLKRYVYCRQSVVKILKRFWKHLELSHGQALFRLASLFVTEFFPNFNWEILTPDAPKCMIDCGKPSRKIPLVPYLIIRQEIQYKSFTTQKCILSTADNPVCTDKNRKGHPDFITIKSSRIAHWLNRVQSISILKRVKNGAVDPNSLPELPCTSTAWLEIFKRCL